MSASAMSSKAQIGEFLRFFDVKRDLYVSEIAHVFSDMKEARLYDDMYSKDDLDDIFGQLLSSVKDTVRRDLETNTAMAALVLEQILSYADEHGVAVSVDMGKTEDAASMARIREMSAGIGALSDMDLKKKNVVKLESMRDEHNRLILDNSKLAEEAAALRERYEAMQAACSALTRDKSEVTAKVGALTAELAALRSGASTATAASAAHAAELESLRAKVAELHSHAETAVTKALAAEKEREANVNMSKPFLMLKQMMGRKNAQLSALRASLRKYEPDGDEGEDKVTR